MGAPLMLRHGVERGGGGGSESYVGMLLSTITTSHFHTHCHAVPHGAPWLLSGMIRGHDSCSLTAAP